MKNKEKPKSKKKIVKITVKDGVGPIKKVKVTLKVKGTQIEFDFMVKDYIFKCLTHRTYGLTEDITYAWQDYNTEKHGDLYSSCCSTGVKVLPF